MSGSRILLTDPIGDDASVLTRTIEAAGAKVILAKGMTWRAMLAEADALIVNLEKIAKADLQVATRCRVIARLGVGVDAVDVRAASRLGIWVTNVREYCTEEVADHTIALILALKRRLHAAQGDLERGTWNQLAYRGLSRISSSTVGIVGLGVLGREVARRCAAIGFRTIGFDPACRLGDGPDGLTTADLDTVLAQSDVVTLHVPLLPSTQNLINTERLRRMKRGALLINVARGGIVDETALLAALDMGHLAGAALDAFQNEPLPPDSPLIGRPNVLLTPHIGFLSEESLISLQEQAAVDVLRVLRGERPINPVNEVPLREQI
jgi:D-3-phosphoglycerate dehydrogenase